MKKNLFVTTLVAFVLAGIIGITSCSKDPIVVPYNMSDFSPIVIPANPNVYGYTLFNYTITQNDVKAALTAAGVNDPWGRLQKAEVKGLKATIEGNGNFDEIGSVEVFLKNTGTSGEGTQVAYSENIGSGTTSFDLKLNGAALKEMVKAGDINVLIKVLTKSPGNQNAVCLKVGSGKLELTVKK